MRARLYLDEDVQPEVARLLRAHGHDAISVAERNAVGLSDEEQLARATQEDRVLVTFRHVQRRICEILSVFWMSSLAAPTLGLLYDREGRHFRAGIEAPARDSRVSRGHI